MVDKYNLPEPPVQKQTTAPFEDKIKKWEGRKDLQPKKGGNDGKSEIQATSVVFTKR